MTKQKLSPVVESLLKTYCADECPGFKVEPLLKKTNASSSEDLGFSPESVTPTEAEGEIASVAISVLVQDSVPQALRENLKQVLAYRASNEVSVPVQVTLKSVGNAPWITKVQTEKPLIPTTVPSSEILKASVWPLGLILISLIALSGLVLLLRHRRQFLLDRVAALKPDPEVPAQESEKAISPNIEEVLVSRSQDLKWTIEDLVSRQEEASIRKVMSLFSVEILNKHQIELSSRAVGYLARLDSSDDKQDPSSNWPWMLRTLESARWKRLEEEANPFLKLSRMKDSELIKLFQDLESFRERAFLFSQLKQDRWPSLLAELRSEERVQVGLEVAHLQSLVPAEAQNLSLTVVGKLEKVLGDTARDLNSLLEDYSLYLGDREGQVLWQEISNRRAKTSQSRSRSTNPQVKTLDEILGSLEKDALAEICMGLEIATLKTLMNHLQPETITRISAAIPQSLRDRLARVQTARGVSSERNEEAQMIKARAHLLTAYRQIFREGSVQ